jgi:hypothetical protein
MTRSVQLVACLLFVFGTADADSAEVNRLLDDGKFGDAYRLALQDQHDHAGDLQAELALARAELSNFRFADGEERLARLVSTHPDEPGILGLQAWLYFATARRDEGWQHLDRAIDLAPEDATVIALRDEQRALDEMFAPPPVESHAPAPRAVAALLEDIRKGSPNDIVIDRFVRGFGSVRRQQFDDFLRGFRDALNKPDGNRLAVAGYALGKTERTDAGDTVVPATVVVRMTFGKLAAKQLGEGAALAGLFPKIGRNLADLPQEERASVIARLVGYQLENVVPVEFTVSKEAPERITDVRVGGKALSTVVGAMRRFDKERAEREQFAEKGADLLKLVGVAAAIGILVMLMRRHDRSQRRSRR